MSLTPRVLAMAGAVLAATTMMTGGAGAAVPRTDVLTFSSHAILTPPGPNPDHFALVSDTCSLKSDGGPASPCVTAASGTLSPTGGVSRAVVASAGAIIILDETYVLTGPNTAHGSGSATRIDARTGARETGTFTADFTTAPTGDPNVLLDSGTVTVTY